MKTTFFGLTSFRNSLSIQEQALKLVEQSGFPVVMGFEFYPVVIRGHAPLGAEASALIQNLKARGFEVVEGASDDADRVQVPGQLVICPLVPTWKLQISLNDLAQVFEETTIQWLQKYKIQAQKQKREKSADEGFNLSNEAGVIADVGLSENNGVARGWVSIHLSSDLTLQEQATDSLSNRGIHLELKQAFDEWNLYFTSALLSAIPAGSKQTQ